MSKHIAVLVSVEPKVIEIENFVVFTLHLSSKYLSYDFI